MPRFACCLLAISILAACNPSVEDTRPGQPVKHRQEAFKELLRTVEPIHAMLRDGQYDADRLGKLTEALMRVREAPWAYYGPDTDYPPSKTRPEAWSRPDAFEAERQRFFAATDALQAATDAEAFKFAYDEMRNSCKSCHDGFRR